MVPSQAGGEMSVEEAVRQVVDIEVEEDEGDPFEGMNNAQIAEIYNKMKPEDRRLFRQFKSFHKLYYNLHGHDAPSHHLARGIVSQIFSGLPVRDTETIANARAELLAAERLKELCKQLGLAIPAELQTYQPPPEAPEYPPPPQPPRFPSRQEKARQAAQSQSSVEASVAPSKLNIKPDMKPPRRLATSYLGPPELLRMLGVGDEDHIITKVLPGTDPLQDFQEDDPSQTFVIDYEIDESSDIDDLSEVSMTSTRGISKQEFQGLLSDVAAQYQHMAASINALASRVEDMSVEQVEEVTVRVTSEVGHMQGLEEITGAFDKSEVALILTCGVHKYHKYQNLLVKRAEKDIISYRQLNKKFGTNKRTLMEVAQGYKYRYPGGMSTKVPFMLTKPEEEEGEEAPTASSTPAMSKAATASVLTTTT